MSDTEMLYVRGTQPANDDGSEPVALWERDPRHPDGEIFVTGNTTVSEVAPTYAVRRGLETGQLALAKKEDMRKQGRAESHAASHETTTSDATSHNVETATPPANATTAATDASAGRHRR